MTVRDRGQASVEFALALPVVAVLVLGVIQVVVVVRDQLAVELAAREGARAAAVSSDPAGAAGAAARRAIGLDDLEVRTSVADDRVTVEVRYRHEPGVPVVGALLPGLDLSAGVTMQREPP